MTLRANQAAADAACRVSRRVASISGLDLLYPPLVRALNLLQKSIVISDYKCGVLPQDLAAGIIGVIAALDNEQRDGRGLPLVAGPHAGTSLVQRVHETIMQRSLRLLRARDGDGSREQIGLSLRLRQEAYAILSDAVRIVLADELRRLRAAGMQRLPALPPAWPAPKAVQADLRERMAQLDYLDRKLSDVSAGLLALRIADSELDASAFGAMCASRIATATGCGFHYTAMVLPWQCELDIFLKMSAVLAEQVQGMQNLANRLVWQLDAAPAAGAARNCLAVIGMLGVQAAGHDAAIRAAASQACVEQDDCLTLMAQYLYRSIHLAAEASRALATLIRSLPASRAMPDVLPSKLKGQAQRVRPDATLLQTA